MYRKYSGLIDVNKVFFDKYQYEFDGNMVALSQQDFVEMEHIDKDSLCWIKYDNDRYLFKKMEDFSYQCWGELLSERIAFLLGIPCVEYRAVTLGENKGLLAKSFVNDGDTLILGEELFKSYYDKIKFPGIHSSNDKKTSIFHFWNQLDCVSSILDNSESVFGDVSDKINVRLLQMLLFDLITLQENRHPDNWGIIKSLHGIDICPLFNNGSSFCLGNFDTDYQVKHFNSNLIHANLVNDSSMLYSYIYQTRPAFSYSAMNILDVNDRINDIIPNVFQSILADWDNAFLVDDFFNKVKSIDLEKEIRDLEDKNGIKMHQSLLFYILNVFYGNISYLDEILQRCHLLNETKKK